MNAGLVVSRMKLTLEGRVVECVVRTSNRARRISLAICPEAGLVITRPICYPVAVVFSFVRRHQNWILKHLGQRQSVAECIPLRWPYGMTLPYRGQEFVVKLQETLNQPNVSCDGEGNLRVHLRRVNVEAGRRLLKEWYWAEASRWLNMRVTDLGSRLGMIWRGVIIRDQRRRWGSCSVTGTLSFNYRLVMMPPAVMDYVVLHELVHRRHMNHSSDFWALVESYHPQYRQARKWLTTYGPWLPFAR